MKKQTKFTFQPAIIGNLPPCGWTLVMSIEKDGYIYFDLHWKDKQLPTHSFPVRPEELAEAVNILRKEMP